MNREDLDNLDLGDVIMFSNGNKFELVHKRLTQLVFKSLNKNIFGKYELMKIHKTADLKDYHIGSMILDRLTVVKYTKNPLYKKINE